jgi:hypothetical protein
MEMQMGSIFLKTKLPSVPKAEGDFPLKYKH